MGAVVHGVPEEVGNHEIANSSRFAFDDEEWLSVELFEALV